jgi:hypothetical protein
MSTPHDDSNNEGNSNVKLMGGGWWKGFLQVFYTFC